MASRSLALQRAREVKGYFVSIMLYVTPNGFYN